MTGRFKVGDKIAAAVLTYKHAALRVGRVEKVHAPTGSIPQTRYTIRDVEGRPHIVSDARSTLIEADEHHTMAELYDYRMVYNAFTAMYFADYGKAIKSWKHFDGELCFGGGWFIVCVSTPKGWVTNHYKEEYWDLFDIPEEETGPEWDGHTPEIALWRLRQMLENPPGKVSAL